ncbi:tether containing UBX domain for GLUT4 [Ischnura elegans]|uniref:tether containing UBX domain for GLUT4 n=1 Tax=Ischnura elegans TaxID=197161 RepID=UPI001ED88932|nr:tether containing UBX domain for GLUT4 [Ischnura elegans]
MASIIVLTPNGRRQTVKVTPNTTLLQVLEQACSKHGFNAQEFDLRHHNKIMNLDDVIRFTGLPNNALLEMVTTTKTRKDSEVTLGVQIETGERFMGAFMPSDTLWTVLNKLCLDEVSKEGNPVVIYMRTEVSGPSSLQTTNLRSLGITGGRAMLRFVHRSPEVLKTQANVSAPLSRPISKHKIDAEAEEKNDSGGTVDKDNDKSDVVKPKENLPSVSKAEVARTESKKRTAAEIESPKKELPVAKVQEEPMEAEVTQPAEEKVVAKTDSESSKPVEVKPETTASCEEEPMDTTDSKKRDAKIASCSHQQTVEVEEEIKLLPGDRSGCAFSMDQPTSSSVGGTDLPDDFFHVTLEDARILLRDLKKKRQELEDAPLLTSAARRQNEAHYLVMPCVIRIMFPNRVVLQGCFVGGETVQDIKSFVSENLEEPSRPFHLYLAPPKVVLNPESLLYEVDGFPTTLLYFAYDKDSSAKDDSSGAEQYLHSSVLTNLTSQRCAAKVAHTARGLQIRNQGSAVSNTTVSSSVRAATSLPSTSRKSIDSSHRPKVSDSSRASASQEATEKVPKWFRPGK